MTKSHIEYNSATREDFPFGLKLMSKLGDGNISISPTSIKSALVMIYEGAFDQTARQISEVAGIPKNPIERYRGFREVRSLMNAQRVPYTTRLANGIWVSDKYPVNSNYLDTLRDNYGAEVENVDFSRDFEVTRKRINSWVDEKTEQKIKELFKNGSIQPNTIIALASALYFKAPWEVRFNPEHTQEQGFKLSSGETVKVDMMRRGRVDERELPKLMYGQLFDGSQIVMIPYKEHQLGKLVILPTNGKKVTELEEELRENPIGLGVILECLHKDLQSKKFSRLEIPKHELRGDYSLKEPLMALGITNMWSYDKANLKGIAEGRIKIDDGIHKTYFKTDEEGSEGAAATGFGVRSFNMVKEEPIEFVCDRPFLEAIVDTRSGALLFLNRIEDPRKN